jgi:hypothetical protein
VGVGDKHIEIEAKNTEKEKRIEVEKIENREEKVLTILRLAITSNQNTKGSEENNDLGKERDKVQTTHQERYQSFAS